MSIQSAVGLPAPALGDAVVVDEDVDLAARVGNGSGAFVGPDVAGDGPRVEALRADRGGDGFGRCLLEAVHEDGGAFASEHAGHAGARAAVAACHEGTLARELEIHDCLASEARSRSGAPRSEG
ncbi:MAG: hypothetical protein R3E53_22265 [Myxococcota bacterium]